MTQRKHTSVNCDSVLLRGAGRRSPCPIITGLLVTSLTLGNLGCSQPDESLLPPPALQASRLTRIPVLQAAVASRPADPGPWTELGVELLSEARSRIIVPSAESYEIHIWLHWMEAEKLLNGSILALETARNLSPADAHVHALAGDAWLEKFRSDPIVIDTSWLSHAVACFQRASELDPKMTKAFVGLALACVPTSRNRGNAERSLAYVERALSLNPSDGMAHYALALQHEAEQRYQDALDELRRAFNYGLSDEVAYFDLQDRYTRMSRLSERLRDQEADGRRGLRRVVANIRNAMHLLSQPPSFFLSTGVARRAHALGLRNPVFYFGLAESYARLGRPEMATGFLDEAFVLDSLHPRTSRFDFASKHMPEFRRKFAGSPYAQIHGIRQAYLGPSEDSASTEAAIRLQPSYGMAYIHLAGLFVNRQDTVHAREMLRQALPLTYHEGGSMYWAANRALGIGEYALALRYYERALNLGLLPRAYVMLAMAGVHELQNERRTADEAFIAADRAFPIIERRSSWGRNSVLPVSQAYERRGDYDRGIAILKEALGSRPSDDPYQEVPFEIYSQLGRFYQKKGNASEAIAAFRTAIDAYPDCVDAYDGIAEEFSKIGLKDSIVAYHRMTLTFGYKRGEEALRKYLPDQ